MTVVEPPCPGLTVIDALRRWMRCHRGPAPVSLRQHRAVGNDDNDVGIFVERGSGVLVCPENIHDGEGYRDWHSLSFSFRRRRLPTTGSMPGVITNKVALGVAGGAPHPTLLLSVPKYYPV